MGRLGLARVSLAIDGSKDDELRVKDLPGIEVGNWKQITDHKVDENEENC